MSKNKDEYLMLRDEIMKCLDVVDNARNILYATTATILAFAFTQTEPLIYLLPYVVILPIYLVTLDYINSMHKIGTYLMVFHEDGEFRWETRLCALNHLQNKSKRTKKIKRFTRVFHVPYLISGFACTVLSMYFIWVQWCALASLERIVCIAVAILLFIVLLGMYFVQQNIPNVQKRFLSAWNVIKNGETSKSESQDTESQDT